LEKILKKFFPVATSDHGDVCYRSDMWAKWVLHFIMSTIDFQGFQVLTVSESKIFLGAPASDVV